jgi:hypothetical protein
MLVSAPAGPLAATLARQRPRETITLALEVIGGHDVDGYERAVRMLIEQRLVPQLDPTELAVLRTTAVEQARAGAGLGLLSAFADPGEILDEALDTPVPSHALVEGLLGPHSSLLREHWDTVRERMPALLAEGLAHPLWSVNATAAELVREHAVELANTAEGNRDRLEHALEVLAARVSHPEINQLTHVALTELRQVQRATRLDNLVPTLREGDDSARIEVAQKILEEPTPEAARVLVREFATWVAYNDAQVVELTAEAIRSRAEMVLPLLDQWERGLELDEYVRGRVLKNLVPRDLSDPVDALMRGDAAKEPRLGEVREWLNDRRGASQRARLEGQKSNRATAQETMDALEEEITRECEARALLVRQRLARLLADMSDERFFDESGREVFEGISRQLRRHAVRILGRRLATEQDITTRESIARTLANVGGREAVDVITRALVDDERTKANRQDLLARYYLEPSKTRSDEVSQILHGAVEQAKNTLRLLQVLNGLFFLAALGLVVAGTILAFTGDTTPEIVGGGIAGLSGVVGLVIQVLREPLVRIQNAVTRLVQIETAFASFIWELNLNGTYIQSQYVAEGRLEDEHIRHTVARIENAMHLAMDLVARYAEDGDRPRIPRLTGIFPGTATAGDAVVLRGSCLKPPNAKGTNGHVLAIDRIAVAPARMIWQDDLIEFTWPDLIPKNGGIAWVNAVIEGTETNALPVQVVATAKTKKS